MSVERWAADWFAEWRAEDHGDASDFIQSACKDAVPGVVGALIVLAEAAGGDEELFGWVGAGPLEDLVSPSGNGLRVLAEVDQAARQSVAFGAALRNVWLGTDVAALVRLRLAELGARTLEGPDGRA